MLKTLCLILAVAIVLASSAPTGTETEPETTEGMPCIIDGKTYESGKPVPSPDNCNYCYCYNGGYGCTMMACIEIPDPDLEVTDDAAE